MDLAAESGALGKIEQDLRDLRAMLSESGDFRRLLLSPRLARAQQESALFAVADKAKFQPLTKNFLGVLTANRRLREIESVIEAFFAALERRQGRVTAQVQTAQDMSEAQIKALQAALSKGLGTEVAVQARVEPSLLGGMIVTVGSRMIDNSVARKLQRLQALMSKPANEDKAA
ncbi:MAG: F0F1 ATP synthase subunit delta [Alphaproteobacteria bacterium]|nr:F0F1 ATP synthase subunit delta [Alphaproteobacteria bacterium]